MMSKQILKIEDPEIEELELSELELEQFEKEVNEIVESLPDFDDLSEDEPQEAEQSAQML